MCTYAHLLVPHETARRLHAQNVPVTDVANSGPRARSETSKSVWLNVAASVEALEAECPDRFDHLDSGTLGETKHS